MDGDQLASLNFGSRNSLEQEHARAEALFSSIGTGAIAIDHNGKVYRINDVALNMLGFAREEVIGKWFPKVVVALDDKQQPIDPLERPVTRAMLSGVPVSEKMLYKRKNGVVLPVSVTVSPVLINGKPIGAIEVFEDISLALEVDRMKSEFISIASHQLRTPLSAISVYGNMLAEGFYGELNDQQKESMETILASANRMNKLISTLLDISKLEAGKISVKLKQANIRDLLCDIVEELEPAAIAKDINLTNDVGGEDIISECDPLLISEVFGNLLSNAIKYTPPGGKVTVHLQAGDGEVLFWVKDNGYGIPKKLHPMVFTKFFRGDNIHNFDTTGTGLGLYMVKQIADVLEGRLWFKSSVKSGTTFYFSLPLKKS